MIHHVFANKANVGDWLSARGIQKLLAPLEVREHYCDTPMVPETIDALSSAGEDDLIVIGGGGLFMDYFQPFWEAFEPISLRVPFCIWGVGCCDMKRERSHLPLALLERVVARSQLCVVRDELTLRRLSSCDLAPPTPCTAMNAVETRPPGFGVLHVDYWDNVGAANYEAMGAAARAFAAATDRSFHTVNNRIPPGDEEAMERILERYAEADLVLTGRLHGCIISLAMGRRVLAVSGDRKMESFMEAAGLGEWVLDLDEVADSLPAKLAELHRQPIPSEFVERTRATNRRIAAQIRSVRESGWQTASSKP
jgi:polysaccharide pyruvyl transferase WcaK-like protein